jgi:flagellar motility protein MotE (MotC chaperone)
MIKLLQTNWMTALLGAVVYLGTTVLVWPPHLAKTRAPSAAAPAPGRPNGPSWNFFNPEVDALVQELKSEKDQLRAQRLRLEEWEARLKAERMELNTVTQAVHQMQADFDQTLLRVRDEEKENLRRLGKVYGELTPEAAAKVVQELADEPVVKILAGLKDSQIAAILEALAREPDQARRVAQLSERLRVLIVRPGPQAKPKSP